MRWRNSRDALLDESPEGGEHLGLQMCVLSERESLLQVNSRIVVLKRKGASVPSYKVGPP